MSRIRANLHLLDDPGGVLPALPLGGDHAHVVLAIPWALEPAFDADDAVAVSLEGPASHTAEGRVAHLTETEEALEVVVRWLDPEGVRVRLPGALAAALTEAADRRASRAEARVCTGPGTWSGSLWSLTEQDVTVLLPQDALRPGDLAPVRLELPDGRGPIELHAQVTWIVPLPVPRVTLSWVGEESTVARLVDRIGGWLSTRRRRAAHV